MGTLLKRSNNEALITMRIYEAVICGGKIELVDFWHGLSFFRFHLPGERCLSVLQIRMTCPEKEITSCFLAGPICS